VIDIYFTLGAPGRSVPEARQITPELPLDRKPPPVVSRPPEKQQQRVVAQVESLVEPPPPERRPVEIPQEFVQEPAPEPQADVISIPVEPEPAPAPAPEPPREPERPIPPPDSPAAPSGNIDLALEDLARILGENESDRGPGGSGGDGIGILGDYLQVIHSRVRANWSFPARADRRQYTTLVNIRIAPDGAITHIRMLRSSGSSFYDSSVENALRRTARFEPPPRPDLMDINIEFAF
jgi:TonB family protein